MGREILAQVLGDNEPERELDHRIRRVLSWLEARDGEGATVAEAARVAYLSPNRFSHLFVEQVGPPFRTYFLWRRLMRAVSQVSRGESLTSAAHQAGFADSAHFSPNRVAALGETVILAVNLVWSAVLYTRFLGGRGTLTALERWQTDYLSIHAIWAALVVILFPPLFGFI